MSFFEDIATALDSDGIESRVGGEVLFVPITSDVEIQFVEVDPHLPAANVYIAAADVDEDDEDFSAALVSVVFSVADAVRTVAAHMAEDQVITVLRDLLDGTDERIGDLEFFQDPTDPNLVRAEVGAASELQVLVAAVDDVPRASVSFVTTSDEYEDMVDQAIDELWESNSEDDAVLTEADRQRLFAHLSDEAALASQEILELGSFADFDKLFDVLALAAEQAENWESQLMPVDDDLLEPDVYDLYGADHDDVVATSAAGLLGHGELDDGDLDDDDDLEWDIDDDLDGEDEDDDDLDGDDDDDEDLDDDDLDDEDDDEDDDDDFDDDDEDDFIDDEDDEDSDDDSDDGVSGAEAGKTAGDTTGKPEKPADR
nr:DNA primase [Corynebacterium frankenforstense]